jgi:hypothetical protein
VRRNEFGAVYDLVLQIVCSSYTFLCEHGQSLAIGSRLKEEMKQKGIQRSSSPSMRELLLVEQTLS